VTSSYDAAAHRVVLSVKQTQRDSLKADSTGLRYVIPDAFTMPVAVRVGTTGGDVVRRAWIRQREDSIVVASVMSAPTMIVFDDGNQILKSLTFDQPTAALAAQLDHDANLWDREWVLTQLVKRPADAAAAAAIARAATSSDYWLTRQVAVTGLSAFPADAAIPALTTSLHDTSAQVRASAAAELGNVKDPRAIGLARAAWQSDMSYSVRASALTALARLDTAGRPALLRQALAVPSYRDAIQNAALTSILRANDTTFIPDMQRLVGDQPLPMRVLGTFAARGSGHALDLVTANLDDSRSWVRIWALYAFGALPLAPRLTALQAAKPHLTHASIRLRVQRAIDTPRNPRRP